ncbi:MAG: hypothetical protein KDJ62_13830 [Rhodobiaceae bacterium]|nr:hypothetical protein [Rhodobiaceae bacterium]
MPHPETAGTAARSALSGPHVCSHVGTQLMTIAKTTLTEACHSNGGSLTASEIENLLDLIASTPEVFSLYTGQYAACSGIHSSGKFTQIDAQTFARFMLQSFCQDIIRSSFDKQIGRAGPAWTRHFLEGLVNHIERGTDPDFHDRLYARYRALALKDGRALSATAFYADPEIRSLLQTAFDALVAETDEHEAFTDTVNTAIGKALSLSGPSPLKVTNADITAFLASLYKNMAYSHFRKAVLTGAKVQQARRAG